MTDRTSVRIQEQIKLFDPIPISYNGKTGTIIGEIFDGKYFAVDFGDGQISYIPGDAPVHD